ncbi:MAG: hypothetical protein IPN34_19580 [Planctomycetes bacterium]|nr:hypothetical protein [Planctomycetota bacterium]
MNARALSQALHRATTALFLVAISLPLAVHLVTNDDARDIEKENRKPAPKPPLSFETTSWTSLPKPLEAYYRDFVRGRTSFLRTQRLVRWHLFGETPVGSETIGGADGWIFFTGNDALAQHRGRQPWSEAMLTEACDVLERRRDQLAERGARYLFVVAPDKMSIFPEMLPEWALPLAERTPVDQLVEAAAARGLSDVILDLRPVLRAKKGELPIYYARGTHWNRLGAYHGYAAIAERLRGPSWPSTGKGEKVLALPPSAVHLTESSADSWDELWLLPGHLQHPDIEIDLAELAEHRLRRSWWPGVGGTRKHSEHVHVAPRRPGSSLLVFHDSFWDSLLPFFANHFAATATCSTYGHDLLLAEALGAQVVLQICVERHLRTPFAQDFDQESRRPWLPEEEIAGSYASPRWDDLRVQVSHPGTLEIEGSRVGRWRAQQRAKGIYVGASPLLGELRLVFGREGGLRNLALIPSGSVQPFRFLESTAGAAEEPLSPWSGRFASQGLVYDVVARSGALWVFDENGELTHVLRGLDLANEGGVAVDPRQPEIRWRFAPLGAGAASVEIEVATEPRQRVELVRRAPTR